jgi:D-3-phosphoglycerate dehydrogenase
MNKVVLAQPMEKRALEFLKQNAEVVSAREGNVEEFKTYLKDAIAAIVGTSIKFTADLMESAPKLKVISRTGAGVDSVDVQAATRKKILVLNTPDANSLSVAEHTVMLICAMAKSMVYLDDQVRSGDFGARRLYLPVDLQGKTLGLVGCGRIGMMVAQKCNRAFDMKVVTYDPFLKTSPEYIKLVESLEDVFRVADFISLHIPLLESTRNIINERLLSLMKPSAFLINTARGGIVDEMALAEKLAKKEIAGAALDVFAKEPPDISAKLFKVENIIFTPHTAALTKECSARVAMTAVEGVVDYIQGRPPKYVFNKEVLS